MNPLENFLERFRHLLTDSKTVKNTVLSVIKTVTNISLEEKEIDIKNYSVYIKAHPSVRNEIFMRKNKILEELQKVLGNKSPKDFR